VVRKLAFHTGLYRVLQPLYPFVEVLGFLTELRAAFATSEPPMCWGMRH
jgi:hypothetical protein